MKINDILKEDKEDSDANYEKIIELSKQILDTEFFKNNKDAILSQGRVLYHGSMRVDSAADILDIKDRKLPQDTHHAVHNIVNILSNEKYGVSVRDKFFTTIKLSNASSYGSPFMVFPIDDYHLYYHPNVDDFYVKSRQRLGIGSDELVSEMSYKAVDIILDTIDTNFIFEQIKSLSEYPFDDLKDAKQLKQIISKHLDKSVRDKKVEEFNNASMVMVTWFLQKYPKDNSEYADLENIFKYASRLFESQVLVSIVNDFLKTMTDESQELFINDYDIDKINKVIMEKVEPNFEKQSDYFDNIIFEHYKKVFKELYIDGLEQTKEIPDITVEVLLDSKKAILIHEQYKNFLLQLLREGSE